MSHQSTLTVADNDDDEITTTITTLSEDDTQTTTTSPPPPPPPPPLLPQHLMSYDESENNHSISTDGGDYHTPTTMIPKRKRAMGIYGQSHSMSPTTASITPTPSSLSSVSSSNNSNSNSSNSSNTCPSSPKSPTTTTTNHSNYQSMDHKESSTTTTSTFNTNNSNSNSNSHSHNNNNNNNMEENSSIHRIGQVVVESDRDYDLMRTIQRGIRRLFRLDCSFPTIPKLEYAAAASSSRSTTNTNTNTAASTGSSSIGLNGNANTHHHNSNHNYYNGERIQGLIWDDFQDDTTFQFRDTHCEVKFLCPIVFMKIRSKFNIDPVNFEKQLGGMAGAFTRMGTPGKSGAFFFYCPSMQYLLKSVSDEECAFLLDMLPNYTRHVSRNSHTLLSNFLSFFEVTTTTNQKFRFVVMNNVFFTNLPMHRRYDLKGSTAGRAASDLEKKKKSPILKDKDIEVGSIKLTRESKLELYQRLQSDCKFLRENDIMDYSLLLGVHDVGTDEEFADVYQNVIHKNNKKWTGEFHNCVASRDEQSIYFFGIIDILQKYNSRKLMEKVVKSGMEKVKSKIKAMDRSEKVSVANPLKYARRFESFIKILCSEISLDSFKLGSQASFERLDEAEEYYNMAVRANTHDSMALFYRAILYYTQLDNKWNAMQDLHKSIKVNPSFSNVLCYLWRGMLLHEQGEYDPAIKDFTKVIEMNPYCPDPYLLRGLVYHKGLKQYTLAERDYSKNLEINPQLIDPYEFSKIMTRFGLTPFNAYVQKGLLYNDLNEKEKAISELKKALDASPKTKDLIYFELGKLYEQHNNMIDAMKSYNCAIEINPQFYQAYFNRGCLRKSAKNAVTDFTKVIELCPSMFQAYFQRGMLYKNAFLQYGNALSDMDQYIKVKQNNVKAYIARGECYYNLQRAKEAESDFLRALELDPNQLEIYNHLTNLYVALPLRSIQKAQYYVDAKLAIMMQNPV